MSTETGKDLLDYGLRRANELKAEQNDDFVPDLKDYINLAYWDIVGEFPWLWAVKYPPYQLTTLVNISVFVSISAGGTTATLSADPGSVVGRKLLVTGSEDEIPMRIASQVGAVLTLAAPYPHAVVNAAASIYQDEYQLSEGILIPLELRRLKSGVGLDLMTHELFGANYGRNIRAGAPAAYSFITDRYIQLGPIPELSETLELWYTVLPPALDFSGSSATDTPILPTQIRWIISDRALLYLLTDMEDPKAAAIISNSSVRLAKEKDRHGAKWKPQFWIPKRHRVARSRM